VLLAIWLALDGDVSLIVGVITVRVIILPTYEYHNGGYIKTVTNRITIGSLQNVRQFSFRTTPAGFRLQMKMTGSISLIQPPSGQTIMIMRGLALAYLLWRKLCSISGYLRLLY
jgi:hypothetical protein